MNTWVKIKNILVSKIFRFVDKNNVVKLNTTGTMNISEKFSKTFRISILKSPCCPSFHAPWFFFYQLNLLILTRELIFSKSKKLNLLNFFMVVLHYFVRMQYFEACVFVRRKCIIKNRYKNDVKILWEVLALIMTSIQRLMPKAREHWFPELRCHVSSYRHC